MEFEELKKLSLKQVFVELEMLSHQMTSKIHVLNYKYRGSSACVNVYGFVCVCLYLRIEAL